MSKKVNWAEVDKRIRNRRTDWTGEELKALEAALNKLPDLAEEADIVTLAQPALQSTSPGDGDASN
jgi:hypothetical protein